MASKYFDCPCGSRAFYHKCCGRFHAGENPENALVLMRSRYSAYAVGNVDYIIETTHWDNRSWNPQTDAWKAEIKQFSQSTRFRKLEIIDFTDGNETASVTFTAELLEDGRDMTFTEKSTFQKVNGRWLYKEGEIIERRKAAQ